MKVYIVFEGEYSGKHVEIVALDRDIAESYIKYHNTKYSYYEIEEYDTDNYTIENVAADKEETKYCRIFSFLPDGSLFNSGDQLYTLSGIEEDGFVYKNPWGILEVNVISTDDYDTDLKKAQDFRAKYLAQHNGL